MFPQSRDHAPSFIPAADAADVAAARVKERKKRRRKEWKEWKREKGAAFWDPHPPLPLEGFGLSFSLSFILPLELVQKEHSERTFAIK